MISSRRMLLAVLGVATFVGPPARDRYDFEVVVPYTDANDPYTPAALRARAERVRPMVEAIVGEPIDLSRIEIGQFDWEIESEREALRDAPELGDVSRPEHRTLRPLLAYIEVVKRWGSVAGVYTPSLPAVRVAPLLVEAAGAAHDPRVLDALLAHELAHVWQDQALGLFHEEGKPAEGEAALIRWALQEGTAEYVAREVGRRLGAQHAHVMEDRVTEGHAPSSNDPAEVSLGDDRWAYRVGLYVVDAAVKAWGEAGTLKRLLADPPRSLYELEHTDAWLAGRAHGRTDLEAWGRRLTWCLEGPPHASPRYTWASAPLSRGMHAEWQRDRGVTEPWPAWRGATCVAGTGWEGALGGHAVVWTVHAFASPADAAQARATLERALDAHGLRVGVRESSVRVHGSPRRLDGAHGATAWSQLVGGTARDRSPDDTTWALQQVDDLLFEVLCEAPGAGALSLELLALAVDAWQDDVALDAARAGDHDRAGRWLRLAELRHEEATGRTLTLSLEELLRAPLPVRETLLARRLKDEDALSDLRAHLATHPAQVTWWQSALGWASGADSGTEAARAGLVAAACAHTHDDVLRCVLARLEATHLIPAPGELEALAAVKRAVRHPDVGVRLLAFEVAKNVDDLALDEAERAHLHTDPEVLIRAVVRKAWPQDDAHAAETSDAKDPLLRDDDSDDAWSVFDTTAQRSAARRRKRERKAQGGLRSESMQTRAEALQGLGALDPEDRQRFLPELVHGLTQPRLHPAAAVALAEPGLDLAPAWQQLEEALAHPRWRPAVLRTCYENAGAPTTALEPHLDGWSRSNDPETQTIALALRLKLRPRDDDAVAMLETLLPSLPGRHRVLALRALRAHRPQAEATQRAIARALLGWTYSERSAALKLAHEAGPSDAVRTQRLLEGDFGDLFDTHSAAERDAERDGAAGRHVDLLLRDLERLEPRGVAERWQACLEVLVDLPASAREPAWAALTRRLEGWAHLPTLPPIAPTHVRRIPDGSAHPALVHAIDALLRRPDLGEWGVALALLRDAMESPAAVEDDVVARHATRALCLLHRPVTTWSDDRYGNDDVLVALAKRPGLDAPLLRELLQGLALGVDKDDVDHYDLSPLFERRPDLVMGALDLLPSLLDPHRPGSLQVAGEILNSVGLPAALDLDGLEALRPHVLPWWGEWIDGVRLQVLKPNEPTRKRPRRPYRPVRAYGDDEGPWWPWAAGGFVVLATAGWFVRRRARRRRGAATPHDAPSSPPPGPPVP